MRSAQGLAPRDRSMMRRPRLGPALLVVILLAALALYVVPRGLAARATLAIADDPVRIAERALDEKFNADVAARGIDAALAAHDADLARSFVDLADARHVALDPARRAKVAAAVADASSARHAAESFALGFVTGVPSDGAALAGTALGDLFVFGDIRDAAREGSHLALGEPTDKLILGLAGVGLAITAGTYATLGIGAPVRVGLSLAKAARKTGRLGGELAVSIGRMLRGVVDWARLRKAIAGASIAEPALAVRAARQAVKLERAEGLLDLARDAGRVQEKAGTRAALDGLKIAESPKDMSRVAKLAEKEGSRTRAILKVARPRRHHAQRRRLRSRHLDSGRAVHAGHLRRLAQERDRTRNAACPAPPQGTPPAAGAAAPRRADRGADLTREQSFPPYENGTMRRASPLKKVLVPSIMPSAADKRRR